MNWRMDEAADYLSGVLGEPHETAVAILEELGYGNDVPGEIIARAVEVAAFWALLELNAGSVSEH